MSHPGSWKASTTQWRNRENFSMCLLCCANWICMYKNKVNCALVQALRLSTGRTVHRGSRVIALIFLDHGTRRGWGVSVTLRPLFTPRKDPVPIVQEAGWAPRPVWTGAENLISTGIRSPERPARNQSLYRLHYPAYEFVCMALLKSNSCLEKSHATLLNLAKVFQRRIIIYRSAVRHHRLCSPNTLHGPPWRCMQEALPKFCCLCASIRGDVCIS